MEKFAIEYRCAPCGHLLFKGFLVGGTISIKCRSCKIVSTIGSNILEENSNAFAVLFDQNGRIVQFSTSAPGLLGYEDEEFEKFTAFDIAPLTTLQDYTKIWEAAQSSHVPVLFSIMLQKKDGMVGHVKTEFRYHTIAGKGYLSAIGESSKNHDFGGPSSTFRSIHIFETIAKIDNEHYFTYLNNSFLAFLGYSENEFVGERLEQILDFKELKDKSDEIEEAVKRREIFSIDDAPFITKSGERIPLSVQCTPIFQNNIFSGYRFIKKAD